MIAITLRERYAITFRGIAEDHVSRIWIASIPIVFVSLDISTMLVNRGNAQMIRIVWGLRPAMAIFVHGSLYHALETQLSYVCPTTDLDDSKELFLLRTGYYTDY